MDILAELGAAAERLAIPEKHPSQDHGPVPPSPSPSSIQPQNSGKETLPSLALSPNAKRATIPVGCTNVSPRTAQAEETALAAGPFSRARHKKASLKRKASDASDDSDEGGGSRKKPKKGLGSATQGKVQSGGSSGEAQKKKRLERRQARHQKIIEAEAKAFKKGIWELIEKELGIMDEAAVVPDKALLNHVGQQIEVNIPEQTEFPKFLVVTKSESDVGEYEYSEANQRLPLGFRREYEKIGNTFPSGKLSMMRNRKFDDYIFTCAENLCGLALYAPHWSYFIKAVSTFPEFCREVGLRIENSGKITRGSTTGPDWDYKKAICMMIKLSFKNSGRKWMLPAA